MQAECENRPPCTFRYEKLFIDTSVYNVSVLPNMGILRLWVYWPICLWDVPYVYTHVGMGFPNVYGMTYCPIYMYNTY